MSQKETNVNEFNKFLNNNQDFLQQKFLEYFKKKSITIQDFKNQAAIKFIYDVFSFSKYESDQKMNKTLQKSLTTNINDFLSILQNQTKQGRKTQFNLKRGVELLKYCIENNEMFAVKYDKKDKKIKTQGKDQAPEPPPQQQQQSKQKQNEKEEETQQQQKQQTSEQNLQNNQSQFVQKHLEQDANQQLNDSKLNNEFQITKQIEKIVNPSLIKKNLKQMFEFYCRQQQNIGVNSTFDRINQECHTMTLGKFLSFAITAGIKNDHIDKNLLMRKYKIAAQGRKQVDFQKFYQIIQTLAMIDQSLISKLGVDEKNAFRNKMKERYYAFNTKDITFRELKKPHIFIPRLTGHSGKTSDALLDQMKNRKQQRAATSLIKNSPEHSILRTPTQNSRYNTKINSIQTSNPSQILTPKELAASKVRDFNEDMQFLQKMINVQEGDEQWLRDYKIVEKNKHPIDHSQKGATTFLPSINRKIVGHSELEKSQTKQSINLRKKVGFNNYGIKKQRSRLV